MLVLSRKLQEQIQIGDEITITVLRVKGNAVRIGIEAPRSVKVIRGELPVNRETEETSEDATKLAGPSQDQPSASAVESDSSESFPRDANVAVFVSDPHHDQVVEITSGVELNSILEHVQQRAVPAAEPQPDSDSRDQPSAIDGKTTSAAGRGTSSTESSARSTESSARQTSEANGRRRGLSGARSSMNGGGEATNPNRDSRGRAASGSTSPVRNSNIERLRQLARKSVEF